MKSQVNNTKKLVEFYIELRDLPISLEFVNMIEFQFQEALDGVDKG